MSYTVTLELPDELMQQYQQGASAARKQLETFIVDRLIKSPLPISESSVASSQEDLTVLDTLDNQELIQIAQSTLPIKQQKLYDNLLATHSQGKLDASEIAVLHAIGNDARRLTLKKSHAFMLLHWRGVKLPSLNELENLV